MIACLDNLLGQEIRPFLLAPGTGDLAGDEPVQQDGRRDMDAVLPAVLDCDRTVSKRHRLGCGARLTHWCT